MKLLRASLLSGIGLLVLTSCNLFGPAKPYDQGDRHDTLVLDRYPVAQPQYVADGDHKLIE